MIHVDKYTCQVAGEKNIIVNELAMLINKLIEKEVIDTDDLYEINEKSLKNPKAIYEGLGIHEDDLCDGVEEYLYKLDKKLNKELGIPRSFSNIEEVKELIKWSKENYDKEPEEWFKNRDNGTED